MCRKFLQLTHKLLLKVSYNIKKLTNYLLIFITDEELDVKTVMKELAALFPSHKTSSESKTPIAEDLSERYSWYTLGLMIGVSKTRLDSIKERYQQMKEQKEENIIKMDEYVVNDLARLADVIHEWIRCGNASWLTLCFGLYALGTESLARDIAIIYSENNNYACIFQISHFCFFFSCMHSPRRRKY